MPNLHNGINWLKENMIIATCMLVQLKFSSF